MRIEIRQLTKRFEATRRSMRQPRSPRRRVLRAAGPVRLRQDDTAAHPRRARVPDRGAVRFAGENVVARASRERQVGFVFQHYALFHHMSVFENVAFGLSVRPRR